MKTIKEKIVNHFVNNHKKLLGGASFPSGNVHPADIIPVGDIRLQQNPSNGQSLDFTANFQIGRMTVFYFGTIKGDWSIENEAIAGRNSDGTLPSWPGYVV